MALLDSSAQVNTIMLRYVSDHSLQVGYIIIQVQVDRVQGYDEDQIVLVNLDLSNFVAQIPVILGTPTIG